MIRVLLVDDEPAFLDMLKFFLEREPDISVDGAPSARDALEKLGTHPYDVILSDYAMPGMDGIEFLKVVRVQGINTPFIMLTGRGREDIAVQALNNGANFYVQKRGDPKSEVVELVSAIRQSAHQREALVSAQNLRQTVEAVVNASPLPIVATDMDGRVTLWSRAAEEIFGWSAEEVLDQHGFHTCDDLTPELRSIFRGALDGRVISGAQIRVKTKDGSSITVFLSLAFVRDENGKPIGTVSVMRNIPSIEHVDESLLQSEDLYRILAESLKDSVYIISRDNTIQYVNRFAAESLGLSAEDMIGQSIDRFLLGAVREKLVQSLKRAFESGESVRLHESVGADKEDIWYDTWLIPLKSEKGAVVAVMGVSRDITEHRRFEEAISVARDEAESIIDYANVLVVGLDAEGNIRLFNKMAEEISGYSREEVVGKNWFSTTEAGAKHHAVANLFPNPPPPDQRFPHSSIHSIVTRNGDSRRVSWKTNELEKNGEVVGVISFGMDITEIDSAQRALRESEGKLRVITQGMNDLITQLDDNEVIQYASPSHRTMLGFDPSELVGSHIMDLVHPDDRDLMQSYIERTAETLKPEPVRFRCRKSDGSFIWLESTGSLLRNEDGDISGGVFGSRDISDRQETEAALVAANGKLNLLSGLTRHDVDNQMSILMGWLEIARQSIDDDAVLRALGSAQGAACAIIKQMEFVSDYQDIGIKSPVWLSPEKLCKKALEHLDLGGIIVYNRLAGVEIFADPLLEKACANLLDNVVRHGVKTTRIDVHCEEEGDTLLIVFEDDGVGIPLENKEHVFEKGAGKCTGLGLYLVRSALGITGITIREVGTPGTGAKFEIIVPKGNYRLAVSGNS